MEKRRVVVTGAGVVSPVGIGLENFWKSLLEGKSGITPITHFDASEFSSRISARVLDYNPDNYFSSKDSRNMSRFIQFAIVAAREAMSHANLKITDTDSHRVGVLIGSGIGSINTLEVEFEKYLEKGPRRITPHFIPKIIINEAAGHVSMDIGAKGFATCVSTACSTATNAIGDALRFIQYGDCDVILAGGSESATTRMGVGGFCALKALSQRNDEPEKASRPFDLNRDGFIMAEGAGIVVLETLEHAKKRGAKILCELVGYGRTSDAYHITAPEPSGAGAADAMRLAIEDAGLKPEDISYINAHGTSTKLNDKTETLAVKTVFGENAKNIPISSIKSMTGHLLGAAGGVEFAACVYSIMNDIVPPTINYETPDPECDLDYVPNKSRKVTVNFAMSNSLGFGGHNASIVAKKFKE